MKPIEVRRATERDIDAIMPVWREMMEVHQEVEPTIWTMAGGADDAFRSYLSQCLRNPDHMIAVAVRGRETLGFIHVSKAERPPVLDPPVEGIISGISVTGAARRQGVGRMLVEEAMKWFAAQGLTIARAGWATANPYSGPFWVAQGFRPYQVTGVRPVATDADRSSARFEDAGAYFASVAETYDRLRPIIAGPSNDAGMAMVLDLVPHGAHDPFTVVDLGCGTGTLLRRVLDRFPAARGVGLDNEAAMLAVARLKLLPYDDRVDLREGDMLACELPACDVVISTYVFHHVAPERMAGLLGRIAGALRPGGCFILLDEMTAGPLWGERVGAHSGRLRERHVAAAIAAGQTTRQELHARLAFKRKARDEGKDVEYRHSAERLSEAMRAAGFGEVGLVWRMFASTILMGFVPERGAT